MFSTIEKSALKLALETTFYVTPFFILPLLTLLLFIWVHESIVFCNTQGKSSLINTFLEKNENPRETLVLEYSFGRKSYQKPGIDKTVCHVWEYGGKLEMLRDVIMSIPIRGNFFFCILIDLSAIKALWNTIEKCLETIEKNYTDPASSPEVVIIGGNYHLFKNLESEVKKLVCSTLRSIALLYKAHVIFYSHKEANLVRKVKEMCHGMGFGKGISLKEKNTNFTKPLIIAKDSDSWEHIGVPPSNLEQIKMRYASRIALEPEIKLQTCDNEIQSTHSEPILDTLSALKYEELASHYGIYL